jgi:hypothetical protein
MMNKKKKKALKTPPLIKDKTPKGKGPKDGGG